MYKLTRILCLVLAGLSFTWEAQAVLLDRGNGLVYDTDQDITWLADFNYAYTSGYSQANAGMMTWLDATSWVNGLNYAGFDDWRLPTTLINDTSCVNNFPGTQSLGFGCIGSELGHLFHIDFGVTPGQSLLTSNDPDRDLFQNVKLDYYWSDRKEPLSLNQAYSFNFANGNQNGGIIFSNLFYVAAVRDGDVFNSVPEPASLLLLLVTLGMLPVFRKKHKPFKK